MPYKTIKDLPLKEHFGPGHRLCQGCGAGIIARLVTKVAGDNTIVTNATGCLEVSSTFYPDTAWGIPYIHVAFENAAAAASGIRVAYTSLQRKGLRDTSPNVIAFGGDGGTADIGLQALSGALERGDHILYICYDNEAYMNTGIQRSSATPYGAWTTTSPPGKISPGQKTGKKDLVAIAVAHGIKYAATANVAYLIDAANKVEKALNTPGASFIHFLSPCTPGWRIDSASSVKVSRLAVQTALWPLYEVVDGEYITTVKISKRLPVTEYLKTQGRFRHMLSKPEEVAKVQAIADRLASRFGYGPITP
jgi:pyruvate ferredoxin oxidoreductase beta subunit